MDPAVDYLMYYRRRYRRRVLYLKKRGLNGKNIKALKLQGYQRGYEYKFSEGGMYPDNLDKPSRTIITSEVATPSRFKHVVVCKINKKKRNSL